jgi:hypothetical protein
LEELTAFAFLVILLRPQWLDFDGYIAVPGALTSHFPLVVPLIATERLPRAHVFAASSLVRNNVYSQRLEGNIATVNVEEI